MDCFKETLRIEAPILGSPTFYFAQDAKIGKYNIKKGQIMGAFTFNLHRDPNQWQRPDEFLPERFDSKDPLFLTPKG